jgi:glucose-6-phosphate isomerase
VPPIPHEPIEYRPDHSFALADDPASPEAVLRKKHLLDSSMLRELEPRLDAVRGRIAAGDYPPDWKPLDAGFIHLPEQLLVAKRTEKSASLLARMKLAADRIRKLCDRVVLLGIGGSSMGTRALFGALCDPYHNELTRGERRRAPRLYFEGDNVDSDSFRSLVELLRAKCTDPTRTATRYGIIVISKSGTTLETSAAFRILRRHAKEFYREHEDIYRQVVVAVTGEGSQLWQITEQDGLPVENRFGMPGDVGGRYSIFTAVGLVPAAVLGINVTELLSGAADMTKRFFAEPPATNPVLRYAGVSYLAERKRGATIRALQGWSKKLEWVGYWYDQLLAESLGKHETGATPITAVGTRDLHSRGQQHQDGRRDKLITNLRVLRPRHESEAIGTSDQDLDDLDAVQTKTLHDCMNAAADGTTRAYFDAARPTADIVLPTVDEYSLGQLFQFFMLATVAEGLLVGVNPFGQPGVEAYKRNMNAILRGTSGA